MTSNFIGASANIAPAAGPTTTTQVSPTTTTQAAVPSSSGTNKPAATKTTGEKDLPKPYYYFHVKMTCSGCSGAIERVLKKNIVSPNEYSVSLEDQTAYVWGPSLPLFEDVQAKIAKTGKEIIDAKPFDE